MTNVFKFVKFVAVFLLLLFAMSLVNYVEAGELYVNGGVARSFQSDYSSGNGATVTYDNCGESSREHEQRCTTATKTDTLDLGQNFGQVEMGYRLENGFVGYVQHTSSLRRGDKGLNLVGVKYELTWKF